MHVNKPEMAKDWEKKVAYSDRKEKKEKKMKREQRVKELIKKMVREELAKMNEDFAGAYPKSMRKKFDGKRRKQSEVLGYKLTGKDDIKTEIDDATVHEAKKRDYKAEYKKYGSSDKAKKYRAELNAYNRKKGTYGNGDGKDASHKGGKIAGFEKESVNRGRREKSRLKKEGKLTEKLNLQKVKKLIKKFKVPVVKYEKGQFAPNDVIVKTKGGRLETDKEAIDIFDKSGHHLKTYDMNPKDLDKAFQHLKKISEGKLTEKQSAAVQRMAKQGMWVVYDTPGEQTIKVVKNERAAKMLIKKLKKSGKYNSPEAKAIKLEGKINEKMDRKKAAIILKQIGGNRFIAMTGAKGFAFSDKYMSFKIGRNSKGINFVRIGHNAKDLYDMEFGFVSTKGIKVKKKVKDVYADMLGQMFKKYTGMNVRL